MSQITDHYGQRVRVRACGLCWQNDQLLMVNHKGVVPGDFWAPPGGGLEFGETVNDCLQREFREETGLNITPGRYLFGCEFVRHPLHAIELYFEVSATGGVMATGSDPELQIIEAVRFMTADEIARIPSSALHGIFRFVSSPDALRTLSGFFTI